MLVPLGTLYQYQSEVQDVSGAPDVRSRLQQSFGSTQFTSGIASVFSGYRLANNNSGRCDMLETIAVILIILWLLGLVSSYTMGGFIHVLLVIAVVVIAVRVIRGGRI